MFSELGCIAESDTGSDSTDTVTCEVKKDTSSTMTIGEGSYKGHLCKDLPFIQRKVRKFGKERSYNCFILLSSFGKRSGRNQPHK